MIVRLVHCASEKAMRTVGFFGMAVWSPHLREAQEGATLDLITFLYDMISTLKHPCSNEVVAYLYDYGLSVWPIFQLKLIVTVEYHLG
jgi:hypothetical protein